MVALADTLEIVCYPNPVLRQPAQPLESIDRCVQQVARRMIDLMHEAAGVGLAAPQVGLNWQLFVANPSGKPGQDQVFINPVLRDFSRKTLPREEGCLSIPDVRGQITRPLTVTIVASNEDGQNFELQADDLAARVWQHEKDHLDGILIIDRMQPIDKMANRRTLKDLEREYRQS